MEDKKISEMAELLYKGAKMLSEHCQECKAPLFKLNDEIFCPVCNTKVKEVEKIGRKEKERDKEHEKLNEESKGNKQILSKPILLSLDKTLEKLGYMLDEEEDIAKIEKILNLISKTADLIERLKKWEEK